METSLRFEPKGMAPFLDPTNTTVALGFERNWFLQDSLRGSNSAETAKLGLQITIAQA
jgi:hypothetical protein